MPGRAGSETCRGLLEDRGPWSVLCCFHALLEGRLRGWELAEASDSASERVSGASAGLGGSEGFSNCGLDSGLEV